MIYHIVNVSSRGKRKILLPQGPCIAQGTSAFTSQSMWKSFPGVVQSTACIAGPGGPNFLNPST